MYRPGISGLLWGPLILLLSLGCSKTEGEGGNSTISGKVYIEDYDADYLFIKEEYYGADEDVFIIYGTDLVYSDDFKTNYDGSYLFKYLRPGTYTIFAYSEIPHSNQLKPVMKTVTITDKNQTVTVDDIVVIR